MPIWAVRGGCIKFQNSKYWGKIGRKNHVEPVLKPHYFFCFKCGKRKIGSMLHIICENLTIADSIVITMKKQQASSHSSK